MVEFRTLVVHEPFRYLWLKYVTGTNLNRHCAQCLKGEYSERIPTEPGIYRDIALDEQPAKILYLCGVSKPYNWNRNFHLPMIAAEGESFRHSHLWITVEVLNARPLPIETKAMHEIAHPKLGDRKYHTCRNWQFANFLELTGLAESQQ